jgi:DNA-binding IscR family transcriptional regulator
MVATRFAVATHILLLLTGAAVPATSARLAANVGTNPVVVRRITGQLVRAGLILVHRGPGGAELARPPETITLEQVWQAVNAGATRPLLPLHGLAGAVRVRDVLQNAFAEAEGAFRAALSRITLADLAGRYRSDAA